MLFGFGFRAHLLQDLLRTRAPWRQALLQGLAALPELPHGALHLQTHAFRRRAGAQELRQVLRGGRLQALREQVEERLAAAAQAHGRRERQAPALRGEKGRPAAEVLLQWPPGEATALGAHGAALARQGAAEEREVGA